MCGIAGHTVCRASWRSREVILGGSAHPEYRGYDSTGIALVPLDHLDVRHTLGKFINLSEDLDTQPPADVFTGIGHTRWMTHGRPTAMNIHPHSGPDGRFSLVRNGVIENADALRAVLIVDGETFVLETDTEVVVHLLTRVYDRADSASLQRATAGPTGADEEVTRCLVVVLCAITRQLHDTFTLPILSMQPPSVIVAAHRSSPLVIDLGEGENFLGSDVPALVGHTSRVVGVGRDEVVAASATGVTVTDLAGSPVEREVYEVDFSSDHATKSRWPTFVEGKIHEQSNTAGVILADRIDSHGHLALDEVHIPQHALRSVNEVTMIGYGAASYAGQVARYVIEHWCHIPVEAELSSEFQYCDPVVDEKTLVVAISQSGETMDTIQTVRHTREQDMKVVAIVNTPGSTISHESDAMTLTHMGPEIAVASTRAFTTQVVVCYILDLYLVQMRGNKCADEITGYMDKFGATPDVISHVLDSGESVRQFACTMQNATSMIYLGYHVGFPVALEGAFRPKEIRYVRAEGFTTGGFKHGPIALVDEGQPVIVTVLTPRRPELHGKVLVNIVEACAHDAHTTIIAEEGGSSIGEFAEIISRASAVPTLCTPLLTAVPL